MCFTIAVYGWLSQLRWVLLVHRWVKKFPQDWHRLVRPHVPFSSQDSGVAGCLSSPVRILEAHDDGEWNGSALTRLSRSGGD